MKLVQLQVRAIIDSSGEFLFKTADGEIVARGQIDSAGISVWLPLEAERRRYIGVKIDGVATDEDAYADSKFGIDELRTTTRKPLTVEPNQVFTATAFEVLDFASGPMVLKG